MGIRNLRQPVGRRHGLSFGASRASAERGWLEERAPAFLSMPSSGQPKAYDGWTNGNETSVGAIEPIPARLSAFNAPRPVSRTIDARYSKQAACCSDEFWNATSYNIVYGRLRARPSTSSARPRHLLTALPFLLHRTRPTHDPTLQGHGSSRFGMGRPAVARACFHPLTVSVRDLRPDAKLDGNVVDFLEETGPRMKRTSIE